MLLQLKNLDLDTSAINEILHGTASNLEVTKGSLGSVAIEVSSYSNVLTESVGVHLESVSVTIERQKCAKDKLFNHAEAYTADSEDQDGTLPPRPEGLQFLAGL